MKRSPRSSPVLHAEGWPRSQQTETTGRCGEKAGAGSEGRGSSPALPARLWSSKGVTASTTGRNLHIPDTTKAPASRGSPRRRGHLATPRLDALGLLGRDLLHRSEERRVGKEWRSWSVPYPKHIYLMSI